MQTRLLTSYPSELEGPPVWRWHPKHFATVTGLEALTLRESGVVERVVKTAGAKRVVAEVVLKNRMHPGEIGAELGGLDCRQEPRK